MNNHNKPVVNKKKETFLFEIWQFICCIFYSNPYLINPLSAERNCEFGLKGQNEVSKLVLVPKPGAGHSMKLWRLLSSTMLFTGQHMLFLGVFPAGCELLDRDNSYDNISGFIWIWRCASDNADNTHIKHVDSEKYTTQLLALSVSVFLSSQSNAWILCL